MSAPDIRWLQRFGHYGKALGQLKSAVELARQRPLTSLEGQGIIQAFEFTHELAWNTLKDFFESRGVQGLYGSKDTTRAAFKGGIITDGEVWMDMIQSRNLTSHTYDEETATIIVTAIKEKYYLEFESLRTRLEGLSRQDQP
jgi:nucleotidyltransferase substrate binding protein (TIGR01987 family)